MASRFEAPSINQSYFERARERLSDSVIAHVRPHGRASDVTLRTPFEVGVGASAVSEQTPFLPSRGETESLPFADKLIAEAVSMTCNDNRRSKLSRHVSVSPTAAFNTPQRVRSRRNQTIEETIRAYEDKKAIRREQCRTNQARYRNRQRIQERRLIQSANELHEEVQELKLKHERQRYSQKTNRSPWAIVSDVFQLLETSFRSPWRMTDDNEMKRHAGTRENLKALQKSFTHGVAMGELSGVEALLEQLRRWSLYFGEPQLHLQRVEEVVPGVLTATARLRVTVSEFTLRCVFPHLSKTKDEDAEDEDELQSLREKLLNQRLTCSCTMTFLQDEETGRMERLETSVDWMGALCQLLGDVRAVAHVLDQALLSSEGVVGDLADHPGHTRNVGTS